MIKFKTKDVSEQLGVNPSTIHRWGKYFNLITETNEHGHYLYSEDDIEKMKFVQKQLQTGKKMKDIHVQAQFAPNTKKISTRKKVVFTPDYENKLNKMIDRVNGLEKEISQKADKVVSYQLLTHRAELDEMIHFIRKLEKRLEKMEEKIEKNEAVQENKLPLAAGENRQR